ncbi:MAG: xylose isomerase [Deltaproteobacteria bacterium]|nr:xylose isomerase [Deltaproteobacteria bacterium]MBW2725147.1 xylose isomerase [Deltaproteobacteria bacterium]
MAEPFFPEVDRIRYEGPESGNDLAFRHYDRDREIRGERMEDLLRFAVCYWHGFCWPGSDVFGAGTFDRPWLTDTRDAMTQAEHKTDVAFEFFSKLGVPFYCFHDRDVAPEAETFRESCDRLDRIAERMATRMQETGVRLLWGTANLFGHPRYAAGAATNPDPEVFAFAGAQVKHCLDVTQRLGGENYVLWGGREGYETLLNTDVRREMEQLGRFMQLVVEHKHRIGFEGTILIEPKPHEPTKHQYDRDVVHILAFLQRFGLEDEIKVNIEVNHATLAGHSFQHELATAAAYGILGSVDANRGDPQNGWDTDQFPNSVEEMTLALYEILRAGGLGTGGINFDAKLRRQSMDPLDLFYAHIGGMDTVARGLVAATHLLDEGKLQEAVDHRYAGWSDEFGRQILEGKLNLDDLWQQGRSGELNPHAVSGRQELLENWVRSGVERG